MPDEQPKKISNYPGNSHRAKEIVTEEPVVKPQLEKIIDSTAVERKKPLGRRIIDTFRGEDVNSVGGYVLFEVMLPAAKTMISDAVSQGIERLMFGDSSPRRSGVRTSGYTPYNRYGAGPARPEPRQISKSARANHEFNEIVLEDRGAAEKVLDRLTDLVDQYGEANVADLYQLVGMTGSFTDDKWGWTDLRGSGVRRIREGYLLELPRPTPLD